MELKGKNALVIGAGKSGIAASRFLVKRGAEVILNDASDIDHLKWLEEEGVQLAGGGHFPELFRNKELIVLSPGVPVDASPLGGEIAGAIAGGADVISEIELASRFVEAPIVAVAGTNGKSTTTTLLGDILHSGGKNVFAGGNLGTPLSQYLIDGGGAELVVLEVSSFQLELIESFRPFMSVMLNVTPDHLDRYKSMEDYVEAKKRLFMNQRPEDFVILNMEDGITAEMSGEIGARIVPFGSRDCHHGGVYLRRNHIVSEIEGFQAEIEISCPRGAGMHDENVMAAVAAALICGVSGKVISETVNNFNGLPHRMEFVGEARGVRFYDDSKATNVGAVVKSLENIDKAVLIAGGKDKGGGYGPLKRAVREKARGVVLIGEAAGRMKRELEGETRTFLAGGMEEAVEQAWRIAEEGDAIILSPACSSFDMFGDYAERGREFRKDALEIIGRMRGSGGSGEEAAVAG